MLYHELRWDGGRMLHGWMCTQTFQTKCELQPPLELIVNLLVIKSETVRQTQIFKNMTGNAFKACFTCSDIKQLDILYMWHGPKNSILLNWVRKLSHFFLSRLGQFLALFSYQFRENVITCDDKEVWKGE